MVRNEGEGERRDVEQISGRTEHARYERAYAPKARGGYGVFQRLFSYISGDRRYDNSVLSWGTTSSPMRWPMSVEAT
jgi:hypothetical protein